MIGQDTCTEDGKICGISGATSLSACLAGPKCDKGSYHYLDIRTSGTCEKWIDNEDDCRNAQRLNKIFTFGPRSPNKEYGDPDIYEKLWQGPYFGNSVVY